MKEITLRNVPAETFTITATDTNDTRPALKADLIKRGYDGSIYTAERVTTGRKRPRTVWAYRTTRTGEYVPMM